MALARGESTALSARVNKSSRGLFATGKGAMHRAESARSAHGHPRREGYVRSDRGPRRPPLGRADAAFAAELPHRLREDAAAPDQGACPSEAVGGAGEHGSG